MTGEPEGRWGARLEIFSIVLVCVAALAATVASATGRIEPTDLPAAVLGLLASYFLFQVLATTRLHGLLKRVGESPIIQNTIHITQQQFYEYLIRDVSKAKVTIDITHHEPRLPTASGIEAKITFFELLSKRMKRSKVLFRWVVAVDNAEKLGWVRRLIRDHKNCNNFSLRVSSFPMDQVVPALSIQIVDDASVFVIDVTRGHHSASEMDHDIYSTDSDLIIHLKRYYERYWNAALPIKEGGALYEDNLRLLETRVSNIAAVYSGDSKAAGRVS